MTDEKQKRIVFGCSYEHKLIILKDPRDESVLHFEMPELEPEVTFYLVVQGYKKLAGSKLEAGATVTDWVDALQQVAALDTETVSKRFAESKSTPKKAKKWVCFLDEIEMQALAVTLHRQGIIATPDVELAYAVIQGNSREVQEAFKNSKAFRLLVAELTPDEG